MPAPGLEHMSNLRPELEVGYREGGMVGRSWGRGRSGLKLKVVMDGENFGNGAEAGLAIRGQL